MRITEILSEDQIDEGFKDALARGVGGVAQGIGAVAGGAAGAWDRMKQGYAKGKAAVANPDAYFAQQGQQPAAASTATTAAPATSGSVSPSTSTPTTANQTAATPATSTQTAPAPQATPDELKDLKQLIQKLNPDQKQDIAAQLTKPEIQQPSAPAAPTGTSVDTNKLKQQSAQQAQAAQADKQTAQQQIAATQAANAEKAKQDAAVKAAKDAAMAKPGFQQTAADKLAIQKAKQMGIREAVKESKQPKKPTPKQPAKKPAPGKKKKVVVEFDSKFLGQKI